MGAALTNQNNKRSDPSPQLNGKTEPPLQTLIKKIGTDSLQNQTGIKSASGTETQTTTKATKQKNSLPSFFPRLVQENKRLQQTTTHETPNPWRTGCILLKLKPQTGLDLSTQEKALREVDVLTENQGIPFAMVSTATPLFSEGTKEKQKQDAHGLDRWILVQVANNTNIFEEIHNYQMIPSIEVAQPDYRMDLSLVPNDPYYSSSGSWGQDFPDLYGLHNIDTQHAWDVSTGSPEVVVAVVDCGVDYTHEDLANNIWINTAEDINHNGRFDKYPSSQGGDLDGIDNDGNGFIDDVVGWDFAGWYDYNGWTPIPHPDNDPMDTYGHGTHCAGTIGAVGNNGIGVVGVNWQVKIMPVKGFADYGGTGYISELANAIVYAADNGANVISNSWGSGEPTPSDPVAEDAVRYAYSQNCMIVFAAGNSGIDVKYFSPQNMNETIAVAAVDHNDEMPSWSNYGEKIDVSAPGVEVLSTTMQSITYSELYMVYPNHEHIDSMGFVYSGLTPPHGITGTLIYCNLGYPEDFEGLPVAGKIALIQRGADMYYRDIVQNAYDAGAIGVVIFNDEPGLFWGTLMSQTQIPTVSISYEDGSSLLDLLQTRIVSLRMVVEPEKYLVMSGTSMACPHVAGLAALIKATHPSWTNEQIRDQLVGTVDDIDGKNPLYQGLMGSGRINASKALTAQPSPQIRFTSYKLLEVDGTTAFYNLQITLKNYWSPAQNVSLFLQTNDPAITLISNHISYGTIRKGESITNNENPFLLTINSSALTRMTTNCTLIITAEGYEKQQVMCLNLFVTPDGWPITPPEDWMIYGGWGWGELDKNKIAIQDLDGDGHKEIIFTTFGGDPTNSNQNIWYIHVYSLNGTEKPGWPFTIPLPAVDIGWYSSEDIQVGDINGDGRNEIVFSPSIANDLAIYALDDRGNLLPGWPIALETSVKSVVLKDINHDGCDEILFSSGDKIFIYNTTGHLVPGWPLRVGQPVNLAVGDINFDGNTEVVAAGGTILQVYGYKGDKLGKYSFSAGSVASHLVIGDVDGDGYTEIVVGTSNYVYLFDYTCQVKAGWPKHLNAPITDIILGNIIGDSRPEVIVKLEQVGIYVFNDTGILLSGFPVYGNLGPSLLTLADINNDGAQEIITAREEQYKIHILSFNGEGSALPQYTITNGDYFWVIDTAPYFYSQPINIVDMDNDGKLECVYTDELFEIYRIELPDQMKPSDWPTNGDDTQRTYEYTGKSAWVNDSFSIATPGFGIDHFKRIQDAITAIPESKNIYVAPGYYQENLIIRRPLNLIGEKRDTTTISGTIQIQNTHMVSITGFTIRDGDIGISLISASHCIIMDDTLIDNQCGMSLNEEGTTNSIYHNNFNNNQENAYDLGVNNTWDNNYPSSGNYWNDYGGIDQYHGPNQDIPGSDSIGDSLYTIPGGQHHDRYPLMQPWTGTFSVPAPNIIHVDDDYNQSTPGWFYDHFTSIQDAINAISEHGLIVVSNGTYYEHLTIGKSLTLLGENKKTTIIDGTFSGSVLSISAEQVTVNGFTIQNAGFSSGSFGIKIAANHTTILGNNITTSYVGVAVYSSYTTLSGNTISHNGINTWSGSGIYLLGKSHNIIHENTISENTYGIYLDASTVNTIAQNTIAYNTYIGIFLNGGSDNTITENTIAGNNGNIRLSGSTHIMIQDNVLCLDGITITGDILTQWDSHTIENNTIDGKPLYYYKNNGMGITVPLDAGQVICTNCSHVIIENLMITNVTRGIQLAWVSSTTITGNTITATKDYGIYQLNSVLSTISSNRITDNAGVGIGFYEYSYSNMITNNILTNNHQANIDINLHVSFPNPRYNNTVSNNIIRQSNNGVSIESSEYPSNLYNNTITDNVKGILVDHSRLVATGNSISDNQDGVYISQATATVTVSRNTFARNNHGIYFGHYSYNNMISFNFFTNNIYGIFLERSSFYSAYIQTTNIINQNRLTNNQYGVFLIGSSYTNLTNNTIWNNQKCGISLNETSADNAIYHNSIVDNHPNANDDNNSTIWDNGYPSGGNYWSVYTGHDMYQGPNQNIPGSDGIGDTPYNISGNAHRQDRYPMMLAPLTVEAYGPYQGTTNTPIQFTGSAVGGHPEFTYFWEFGDGATAIDQNTSHQYTTTGTFIANLTVIDLSGNQAYDTAQVVIKVNHPPNTPRAPQPMNGQTNVGVTSDLSWTGGDLDGDQVTYDVYIGIINPPLKIVSNQSGTSYDPGTLYSGMTYYWMIVAWDSERTSGTGPIWQFSTHNDPPNNPRNPIPSNGATGVPVDSNLSWIGGDSNPGDTVTYDVYLDTVTPPLAKVSANQSSTVFHPGIMNNATEYFWRIVSWDNHGASRAGTIWQFTTETVENHPPATPRNPHPLNGEINVDIVTNLSWTGSDPDQGDVVSYDVYFGVENPPQKLVSNQSLTTFNPGELSYHATYYWKILAWDNHGASTIGPSWSFITKDFSDTEPPVVQIIKPGNAVYINNKKILPFFAPVIIGTITIKASATDNQSGINQVEFYLDGILKFNCTAPPYDFLWNTKTVFKWRHTIAVIAFDNSGNEAMQEIKVWKFL